MNWDAIVAISQLVAAVGVILSLVFVGLQIKQNTRALQRTEHTGTIPIRIAASSSRKAVTFSSARTMKTLSIMRGNLFGFARETKVNTYEVRPRKDHRGVDLISDALAFGRLWYEQAPDMTIVC